jgi:alkylated DNA repair dioxygenase AlkB
MRITTVLPPVGPSGFPEYGPEDAFFIPEFACAHNDYSLMKSLRSEIPEGRDFSEWHGARHLGMQFEGADVTALRLASAPPTLRATILKLEAAFGIEASATRVNIYRSTADYKPLHADRGQDTAGVPQVTVGLSLGATRELSFAHWQTGLTTSCPQHNGDVFAFTPELNKIFLHGVPKVRKSSLGSGTDDNQERLSLILWGSRISLRQVVSCGA